MFSFRSTGSLDETKRYLRKLAGINSQMRGVLDTAGREGVSALASSTPRESGLAASSWDYRVSIGGGSYSVTWINTDVESGFQVAIQLQYGYGTGTGGYVQGQDYINPAMRPIFDNFSERVRKVVTSA